VGIYSVSFICSLNIFDEIQREYTQDFVLCKITQHVSVPRRRGQAKFIRIILHPLRNKSHNLIKSNLEK
jgi:hypothetical protein